MLSLDDILQLVSLILAVPQSIHAVWELVVYWVRGVIGRDTHTHTSELPIHNNTNAVQPAASPLYETYTEYDVSRGFISV
ncbi:hypothetical protein AWENTII_001766 [Aspergillus wentii]